MPITNFMLNFLQRPSPSSSQKAADSLLTKLTDMGDDFFEQRKTFKKYLVDKKWNFNLTEEQLRGTQASWKPMLENLTHNHLTSDVRLAMGLKTTADRIKIAEDILRSRTNEGLPNIDAAWKLIFQSRFEQISLGTVESPEAQARRRVNQSLFTNEIDELVKLGNQIEALRRIKQRLFIVRQAHGKSHEDYLWYLELYLKTALTLKKHEEIQPFAKKIIKAIVENAGYLASRETLSATSIIMSWTHFCHQLAVASTKQGRTESQEESARLALQLWKVIVEQTRALNPVLNPHQTKKLFEIKECIDKIWEYHQLKLPRELKPRPIPLPPQTSDLWTILSANGLEPYPSNLDTWREVLDEIILFESGCRRAASRYTRLPQGGNLLLYGATGCGKTFLLYSLLKVLNKTVIQVTLEQLISSKQGETQKNIERLFEFAVSQAQAMQEASNQREADNQSKVAILIDNAHQLLHSRDGSHIFEEDRRNINTFLRAITGLRPGVAKYFQVFAATTNKEDLDSAVCSRFQKIIKMPEPSEAGIEKVLRFKLGTLYETLRQEGHFQKIVFAALGLNLYHITSAYKMAEENSNMTEGNSNPGTFLNKLFMSLQNTQLDVFHGVSQVEMTDFADGTGFKAKITCKNFVQKFNSMDAKKGVLRMAFKTAGDRIWFLDFRHANAMLHSSSLLIGDAYGLCLASGPDMDVTEFKMRFIKTVEGENTEIHRINPPMFKAYLKPEANIRPGGGTDSCYGHKGAWQDLGVDLNDLTTGQSAYLQQDGSLKVQLEVLCQAHPVD